MTYSLFWGVSLHRLRVSHGRFGTTILIGLLTLEVENDRLSRNVGNWRPIYTT